VQCYDPTWVGTKTVRDLLPEITTGAVPYFESFGDNASPFGLGYYSYEVGAEQRCACRSGICADALVAGRSRQV
jgi:hypothetical protein